MSHTLFGTRRKSIFGKWTHFFHNEHLKHAKCKVENFKDSRVKQLDLYFDKRIYHGVNKARVRSDSDLGIWPGPCRIIYRFAEDEARDRRDQCSVLGALSGSGVLPTRETQCGETVQPVVTAPSSGLAWVPGSALQLPAHHQPVTSDQPHLRTQWGHALSLRVSRISHTRRKSALLLSAVCNFTWGSIRFLATAAVRFRSVIQSSDCLEKAWSEKMFTRESVECEHAAFIAHMRI